MTEDKEPKRVPLVVYVKGERTVVGEAIVHQDGRIEGTVTDNQVAKNLIGSFKDFSIVEADKFEEQDRNARAYGFEIGKGRPLNRMIGPTSEDNPFMDPDWRDQILNKLEEKEN